MKKLIAIITVMAIAASAGFGQVDDILRAEKKIEKRVKHDIRDRHDRVYYENRTVWKGNKEYGDVYRITIKNGKRHEKRVSHHRIR